MIFRFFVFGFFGLIFFFWCLFFFLFRIYFYSFLVNLSLLICFFPCFVGNRFPCFLSPFYFVLFRRKFTVISCSFLSSLFTSFPRFTLFVGNYFPSFFCLPPPPCFTLTPFFTYPMRLPFCFCTLRSSGKKNQVMSFFPITFHNIYFTFSLFRKLFFSSEKCNVTKSSCNTSKMSISHSHSFFI